MKASVDQSGCIGCELCANICPDVFHMTADGLAETDGVLTEETVALAQEAADSCPVSVISIEA